MNSEPLTLARDAAFGVARSFTDRRWRLAASDGAAVEALVRDAGLSSVLARLLANRGINASDARDYLQPTLKKLLPEPLTLKDMDRAVARAAKALDSGEKIAIWGDYDVDGSTSAALLSEVLTALGAPPRIYIPDRMTEGYGPNTPGLLKLKSEGIGLVITVDCGAGAAGPLSAAREAGLDVIVLDHHAVEAPPPSLAHVNPNQPGDVSGLGYVCAAGITFLFAVALVRALREANFYDRKGIAEPDMLSQIDLVGLATVADVVPLVGVNRALVRQGLARLNRLERPGLAALAAVAQAVPPFTPYSLGFVFGPRINAGGRVGRSSLGVELLTATSADEATRLARALDLHNRERQGIEKMILDEAIVLAEASDNLPFVFAHAEGWHAGVVGIVAGRLKERFGKPAFVAGFEGGIGRGSVRSVAGVDVGAIVRAARDGKLIESGGGHAMAAGFGLLPGQIDGFRAHLIDAFARLSGVEAAMDIDIDAIVSPAGATVGLVEEIAQAGPYGAGNAEPTVAVPDALVQFADVVGQNHVRLRLAGGDGARLDAIAFRVADMPLGRALLSARGQRIHIAGRLKADVWQGRKRVQLQVEDAASAGA